MNFIISKNPIYFSAAKNSPNFFNCVEMSGKVLKVENDLVYIKTKHGTFNFHASLMDLSKGSNVKITPFFVDTNLKLKIIFNTNLESDELIISYGTVEFTNNTEQNNFLSSIISPKGAQACDGDLQTPHVLCAHSLSSALSTVLAQDNLAHKLHILNKKNFYGDFALKNFLPSIKNDDFISALFNYLVTVKNQHLIDIKSSQLAEELKSIQMIFDISKQTNWSMISVPIAINDTYKVINFYSKDESVNEDDKTLINKRFFIDMVETFCGCITIDCLYKSHKNNKSLTIQMRSEKIFPEDLINDINQIAIQIGIVQNTKIHVSFAQLLESDFSPRTALIDEQGTKSANNILA